MGTMSEGLVDVVLAHDGTVVVHLRGEIDLASAPAVEDAVRAELPGTPAPLVFDLTDLRFMDSSGIAVLLRLACDAASVTVRKPNSTVAMVITATGLTEILPVADD